MPTIGKLLGMPESRRTYEDSKLLALRKCLTGLEFEAENVKKPLPMENPDAGLWDQKADGSLRGASMEYVLREPLFGEDLIRAIRFLCNWATEERLETNYRTGLHVHIDVRNLDVAQLISMTVYYALFERIIFNWVGDKREGSIFCMPMYKAQGVLPEIATALKAEARVKDAAKAINRYGAFNMNSLSRFGTVEWRHMQTTFNEERVIKWVNICQSFKKYAKNFPLNPQQLLQELSKEGPDRIFAHILGPSLSAELWTPDAEHHVWETGIPTAQEIATLLEGDFGMAWDSVRQALGTGTNPRFAKWAKKVKDNPEMARLPENIFAEPELLKDPEIQKEALAQLTASIREKLEEIVLPAD